MDAIKDIFAGLTEKIPLVTAALLLKLFLQVWRPYAAVIMSVKICRQNNVSTILLTSISFLLFALALGLPSTQHLIFRFDMGPGESLKKLSQIDSKDLLFYYLIVFIFCSTVIVVVLSNGISDILGLRRFERRLFIDSFRVFVCFTLWNFMILSIIISALSILIGQKQSISLDAIQYTEIEIYFKINVLLNELKIPYIRGIVKQYSFILTIFLAAYFGFKLLQRWVARRGRADKYKYLQGSFLFIMPIFISIIAILIPSIIIVWLATVMWSYQEQKFRYTPSCMTSGGKALINLAISNKSSDVSSIDPILIKINNTKSSKIIKVDPASVFWASRTGVLMQPKETRFLRFSVNLERYSGELTSCTVLVSEEEKRGVPNELVTPADADAVSTFRDSEAANAKPAP